METDGAAPIDVPVLYPAVVVAVGRADGSPHGADVAITEVTATDNPAPAEPWVGVADVATALDAIERSVRANPLAAAALVQLLRVGAGRPAEDGLVLESVVYSMLQSGPEFATWRSGRSPSRQLRESHPPVLVERRGEVLQVTLNRPEVHNAYNRAMRDALCEALSVAMIDRETVVEITGRGASFCSGGDLTEFGTASDPVSAHRIRSTRSPARLLAALSPRVRVTLHGACAGSGIELPAFAGFVSARPDTRIWLPELRMGLIPGAGGTVSLTRRIGRQRTAWLALTGSTLDASTALGWGLVDELSGA